MQASCNNFRMLADHAVVLFLHHSFNACPSPLLTQTLTTQLSSVTSSALAPGALSRASRGKQQGPRFGMCQLHAVTAVSLQIAHTCHFKCSPTALVFYSQVQGGGGGADWRGQGGPCVMA